jgi:5-(carboxyamino)imidazole ribonucleotide synthase
MKVGILGGGQLARMLALAGHPLGLEFVVLDPHESCPAGSVATHIRGAFDDAEALERFARDVDVVTFEFENVPAETARILAKKTRVLPNPEALVVSQDRALEKEMLASLGFAVARTAAVQSMKDLVAGVVDLGLPCVLKTRTLGYDGLGQFVLRSEGDVQAAWDHVGRVPCILESWVPFERELALSIARDAHGNVRVYPLVETVQSQNMLASAFLPAMVDPAVHENAAHAVIGLATRFGYVGVLTVEFFLDAHGYLIANEIAPRVHDSAHGTIESCVTSQFENHVRAIAGLPLGSTELRTRSVLWNVIGREPSHAAVLEIDGAHLHSYGKTPAPGRKLGHVTLCDLGDGAFDTRVLALSRLIAATNDWRR